jgi:hypothetical protein
MSAPHYFLHYFTVKQNERVDVGYTAAWGIPQAVRFARQKNAAWWWVDKTERGCRVVTLAQGVRNLPKELACMKADYARRQRENANVAGGGERESAGVSDVGGAK